MKYGLIALSIWSLSICLTVAAQTPEVPVSAKPVLPVETQIYQQTCAFCHQPKPVTALPDIQAWTRLLYTSGCPQVTVKLDEHQRRAIKTHLEKAFKSVKSN